MGYRRPIATIDCETDPFERKRIPRPFVWGFYDAGYLDPEKPFRYFTETDELVDFLRTKEYVVFCHNGGRFDYHYLWDYIDTYDSVLIIDGRMSKFQIGIAELRDSWNVAPIPLRDYKKNDFDYKLNERVNRFKPENWAKIVEYLESDCVYLYELVSAFVNRFGLVLTRAGAAMREWRKISGKGIPRSDEDYYLTFKPYYHGGRTQAYEIGVFEEPFQVADINSAYPFAMLHRHPYGLGRQVYLKQGLKFLDELDEVGPCLFSVRCISEGALPHRDNDGSLDFPDDGELRTYHCTGWELQAALDEGTIHRVHFEKVYVFDELRDFKPFVDVFYPERLEAKRRGDKAADLLAKGAMNSLYGKFGANPAEYREFWVFPVSEVGVLHPDNAKAWLALNEPAYKFAGFLGPHVLACAELPPARQRFYNVATAASITGFIRAYLYRAVRRCSGVLYTDTDSIAAREIDVPIGKQLGEWGIEGTFTRAGIAGKKLYAFRYKAGTEPLVDGKRQLWKVAHKGAQLSPRQILAVARGKVVEYVPEAPTFSVKGYVDKKTGKREIARFVPRTIKMQEKDRRRRK